MEYLPHQQRVIDEMAQHEVRTAKLGAFLVSPNLAKASATEQQLLRAQHQAMVTSLSCLKARIRLWGTTPAPGPAPLQPVVYANASAPVVIKPTVGRRVWYWPSDYDRGLLEHKPSTVMTASDDKQPCDAGVAYVWNDRMVNLTVADHNGVMHQRTSVQLVQEGDPPPPPGGSYAVWMPYQQGQAKPGPVVAQAIKE